jgi:microcystin degradation protein MlrC
MTQRVGIVSLMHESNTFLRAPTAISSFQQDQLLRGDEVRRLAGSHHEVGGFFAGLGEAGIDAVPIFAARAIPSGPIAAEAFRELLAMLDAELDRAETLDGLLVAPHGAAVCESAPDADGFWLSRLRQRFPRPFPILGTLDPHGNLSQKMIEATDALTAYRSNPHLDQKQRGLEAAALMARALRGEIRPTQAAALPPLAINIERQRTAESPCLEQYQFADAMLKRPKVLSNSLMLGFPYADVAEMGSAVIVVTNDDQTLAQTLANEWGEFLWSRRHEFVGKLIEVADAVDFAVSQEGPICLLDMGDNVGGGSPGDGTILIHELHRRGLGPAFACLFDPDAVRIAEQFGAGGRSRFALGGKTDDLHGPPLEADFQIVSLHDGRFDEPVVRHGGYQSFDQGRTAIVRSDSGLTIMLTSRRVPPFSLRQLTAFGLDPAAFRAIVAKGVHAPVAAYAPVCKQLIRVNTPGVTTADLSRLQFHHRRRPMFPFEPDTVWQPKR